MSSGLLVEKEWDGFSSLSAGVWTTGLQDGNAGQASRTVVEIRGGDGMAVQQLENGVRLELQGDLNLEEIIGVLEFAAQELRRQRDFVKPARELAAIPAGITFSHTGLPSQAVLSNGANLLVLLKARGGAFVTTEEALMALDINRALQRLVKKLHDQQGSRSFAAYLRGVFCDNIHVSQFTAYIDLIFYGSTAGGEREAIEAAIEELQFERFGHASIHAQVTARAATGSDWYFDTCDEFYAPVRQALFWE